MERVQDAPFTPEDRIGALELQNLSVTDNRAPAASPEQRREAGRRRVSLGKLLGAGDDDGRQSGSATAAS